MDLFHNKLYPAPSTLPLNQQGLSSLVLLLVLVLGVFVIWEFSEYIRLFTNPPTIPSSQTSIGGTKTFCTTGEQGNCNDSNDQFLFVE